MLAAFLADVLAPDFHPLRPPDSRMRHETGTTCLSGPPFTNTTAAPTLRFLLATKANSLSGAPPGKRGSGTGYSW